MTRSRIRPLTVAARNTDSFDRINGIGIARVRHLLLLGHKWDDAMTQLSTAARHSASSRSSSITCVVDQPLGATLYRRVWASSSRNSGCRAAANSPVAASAIFGRLPRYACQAFVRTGGHPFQVLEVAQHDHRALPRGQGPQRLKDGDAAQGRLRTVRRGRADLGHRRRRWLAAPPRDVRVVQRPAHVRLGIAVANPRPVLVRLRQRRLQQVLGEVVVAGEQVRRPGQRRAAGAHEVPEVVIPYAVVLPPDPVTQPDAVPVRKVETPRARIGRRPERRVGLS